MPRKKTSGRAGLAGATPLTTSRGQDKSRHARGDRRNAPALRGSDWPTNDMLEARPSAASRKRSRTAEARANRPLH
jgi:hypothetical protein